MPRLIGAMLSFFGVKTPSFRHGDEMPSPFALGKLLFSSACARIELPAH
jgi:hypothetical protein